MSSNGDLSPPRRRDVVERSSTEIVHSLFGTSVGRCWGDFSCSHYRQRGRMYAASNAIGFFSNLFGFERRILLHFEDVTDIKQFRTTSIQVTTTEGEQYIFKSFENRELVVLLLMQLKQGHANGSTRHVSPLETSVDMSVDEDDVNGTHKEHWQDSHTTLETMSSTVQNGDEPASPGVQSEAEESATTDCAIAAPRNPTPDEPDAPAESTLEPETPAEIMLEKADMIIPETSSREHWEKVKNAEDPPYNETSIDGLLLPCTLDEFFALFLADNAPHSIDAYQTDCIGDSELTVSSWTTEGDDSHVRVIKFRHPLPNNLGVGPPSALAERHQRFRRYGSLGFCLETSTSVKGVIASDSFFVDDKWIVEPIGETNVTLTVKHQVRFTKRTMLKRVIQNTSSSEARAWYAGYFKMLVSSLEGKDSTEEEEQPNEELQKEETETIVVTQTQPNLVVFALLLSLLAGIGILLLQMASLQRKVALLEDEVSLLREENEASFARLEQAFEYVALATVESNRNHPQDSS